MPRPEIWRRPLGALASLAAVPAAAPTAEEEGNEIDFWKFRRRIWEDWIGAPKKGVQEKTCSTYSTLEGLGTTRFLTRVPTPTYCFPSFQNTYFGK